MNETTTMTPPHRRHLAAISGVTALLLATVTLAVPISTEVDETRTVQPGVAVTRVEVDIDAGDITLVPADELAITIERHAGRFAARPSGTTQVTGRVLRVTGSCSLPGVGRCHTPVTIATPPGIAIRASTAAGSIDGEIVRGGLEATTSAGSISLAVTAEVSRLSAATEAGHVHLTVPDDVYTVDARTSLGRTRVEVDTAADATKAIQARSEVGRITIRTHDDADAPADS